MTPFCNNSPGGSGAPHTRKSEEARFVCLGQAVCRLKLREGDQSFPSNVALARHCRPARSLCAPPANLLPQVASVIFRVRGMRDFAGDSLPVSIGTWRGADPVAGL